jgi:hypothetical protein
MARNQTITLDHDIEVVIQEGGSSQEFYAMTYDTEELAQQAIDGHAASSYNAFGPYKVPAGTCMEQSLLKVIERAMSDAVAGNYAEVTDAS